ncbi:DEAD/DEAH box helicase [Lapidilactobacillus luobeiensis]|uniref:DEAD/DEAH box helicase n=1 Tax=Lapidilactobacillus luobeiensis TaxID=2950371 RepID=UPI0021C43FA4|nr:DEAD/DEAH box helicase [Lapidilactobacillus luobeiensis]
MTTRSEYQAPIQPFMGLWQTAGFTEPTPIQKAVYWPLKQGEPVLGLAATGKGKTLAFGLPLLETLQPGQGTQLLILEPSAELVMQVREVLRPYAAAVDLKIQGVVGKANLKRQLTQLKEHPEVIVATVGRLTELLGQRQIKPDRLTTLVIDEADLQLDPEHIGATRELISKFPADVQLALMSATEQPIFKELAQWFGYDFVRCDTRAIDQQQQQTAHDFLIVGNHHKAELMKQLARGPISGDHALVFVRHQGQAQTLFKTLKYINLKVGMLTGRESSQERQRIMQQFRQGKLTYLVTTELAARGLDFAGLSFVINYDMPADLTSYIHRAGRTGRMAHQGTVINLGNDHDRRDLQKLVAPHYRIQTVYLLEKHLQTEKPLKTRPNREKNWSMPKADTPQSREKAPELRKKTHKKKRFRDQKNIGKHR